MHFSALVNGSNDESKINLGGWTVALAAAARQLEKIEMTRES